MYLLLRYPSFFQDKLINVQKNHVSEKHSKIRLYYGGKSNLAAFKNPLNPEKDAKKKKEPQEPVGPLHVIVDLKLLSI